MSAPIKRAPREPRSSLLRERPTERIEGPPKRRRARPLPTPPPLPAAAIDASSPPWWLLALEGRAVFEWGAWWLSRPLFQHAPRGRAHPVLALPGLIAGDRSTWPLRRFLGELGYHARPWEEGINRGPQPGLQERLIERVARLADEHGEQVSLVGWSLGGLMARSLAWHRPDLVRSVITLGSPLSAVPRQTNAAAVFRLASGLDPEDPALHSLLGGHPEVPLTSILSRSDGVVHWRASLAPKGERCESIEVPASHLGLGVNPLALYAIADRLAQSPDAWQPFEHSGWRRLLFRDPHLDRLFGG